MKNDILATIAQGTLRGSKSRKEGIKAMIIFELHKINNKMKKVFFMMLMVAAFAHVSAQTRKVSVLGDSYSTFTGVIPEYYSTFYPNDRNDVKEVEQTWWSLYIKAKGYTLEKNDSWGGTTICGTGYGRMDSSRSNFISRVDSLGNPDIIFVFGGTNDAWANSPIGEYQYSDWTKEDCKNFRPLHDIEKQNGHPSIKGMKSICEQLLEAGL